MGWVLLIILAVFILFYIGNRIKNHNGMDKYANEKLDKEAEHYGVLAYVVIVIALSYLFPNPYFIGILTVFGIYFAAPISIYIFRKARAEDAIKYESVDSILEIVDNMNGQEFEEFLIKNILPHDGYMDIKGTKYSGDYGVDIVAIKDGLKCAIQCKRFNKPVNLKAIQEIVAGRKHYKCEKAIVITNNYFNESARNLAEDNHVILLDRDYLIRMIKKNDIVIEMIYK